MQSLFAIPEYALAEAPKKLDAAQASMIGTPWTTAWLTLDRAQAKRGETVLVTGANGSVGSAVVQLAKSSLRGCHVIRAGRGNKYDVDVTANPDLSTVKELIGGKGPDVVIDTTGDLNLAYAGLRALNKRGRLAIITTGSSRGSTETKVSVDFKELYRFEHCVIGCSSFEHSMEEMACFLQKLAPAFDSGEIQAPDTSRVEKVSLDKMPEAYAEMSTGSRKHFLLVL